MKPSTKKLVWGLIIGTPILISLLSLFVEYHIDHYTKNKEKIGIGSDKFYIDQALEEMIQGSIAFNTPDSMELNESSTIQLLLNPFKSVEELENMINKSAKVKIYQIKISHTMQARLTGNGFQITAITSEEQPISKKETTEWKWDIKAIEYGTQQLHLTLSAVIHFQGKNLSRAIRTIDKTILVRISFVKWVSNFTSKNWQWLWTALLIPVGSWLWKRRKSSKNNIKDSRNNLKKNKR